MELNIAPPPPIDNVNSVGLCSGIGQYHTDEYDPDKPEKQLTPYTKSSLDYIRKLVDIPPTVKKSQAEWVIPSTLLSRNFNNQQKQGTFYCLWADLD